MRRSRSVVAQWVRRLNLKRPVGVLVAAVLIAFGAGWAINGATGTTEPVAQGATSQPVEPAHDDAEPSHDDAEPSHDDAEPEATEPEATAAPEPPPHGDDGHNHDTDHD